MADTQSIVCMMAPFMTKNYFVKTGSTKRKNIAWKTVFQLLDENRCCYVLRAFFY